MSKRKDLVPLTSSQSQSKNKSKDSSRDKPTERRRIFGCGLVVIAFILLLPEFQAENDRKLNIRKQWPSQPEVFRLTDGLPESEPLDQSPGANSQPQLRNKTRLQDSNDPYAQWRNLSGDEYDNKIKALQNPQPVEAGRVDRPPNWQDDYAQANPPQSSHQRSHYKSQKPAWFVQVASMSSIENAQSLKSKLQTAGFRTLLKTHMSEEQKLYRVLVGPQLRRKDAVVALQSVRQQFPFKPVLRSYYP